MLSGSLDVYKTDGAGGENNMYDDKNLTMVEGSANTMIKSGREATESNMNWCTLPNGTEDVWTDWAKIVQCISHFLLTFYSSITFPIFYVRSQTLNAI